MPFTYPVLLRRTCSGLGQFTQVEYYYDGQGTQNRITAVETFECAPYELPIGTVVGEYCQPAANPTDTYGVLWSVRYKGNGEVEAFNPQVNNAGCPLGCDVDGAGPFANLSPDKTKWFLDAQATSSVYPIAFLLSGYDPFIVPAPDGNGVARARFVVPLNGRYAIQIKDGAGCGFTLPTVTLRDPALGGNGSTDDEKQLKWVIFTIIDTNDQTGEVLGTRYERRGSLYRLSTREVETYVVEASEAEQGQSFSRDVREELDRYLLPDNRTLRRVFHDGNGGVRFVETVEEEEQQRGELELLNLIKTDIDEAATATGRVWVEADSPALPIRCEVGGVVNETGQFSDLAAGDYVARLTDAAGRSLAVPFTIEDRYRLRWELITDDVERAPVLIRIYERDYQGEAESICMGEVPVKRTQEGAGADPEGNWPEVIGGKVELTLLTSSRKQFADMALRDDRQHRVDIVHGTTLVFRGYVAPDTYREPILSGRQYVSVIASDGLGTLGDTEFLNHEAQPMRGRRPLLSTLLHCLSRCDVNLPLYVAANLREVSMELGSEPLLEAWAQRTAYGSDDKVATCREVLEAILRPLFCQLSQRNGAWWVEAIPELNLSSVARRGFTGEGLPVAAVAELPFHILPPSQVETSQDVFWVEARQMLELTPQAAAVQATIKLQLEESLLQNSDFQQWAGDLSRPLGWTLLGAVPVYRVNADKVGRYWLDVRPFPDEQAGLLSSPVRLLAGQDLSPLRLSITAKTLGLPSFPGEPVPEKRIVRLPVELTVGGIAYPELLFFEFDSSEKMGTQETLLPADLGEGQLRIRLLPVVPLSGPPATTQHPIRVLVESVNVAIVPASREWPDQDQFTAVNAERGYYLLPPVELVHADIPRLPLASGLPAPVSQMDVDAWRHALSRPDRTATETWSRLPPGTVGAPEPLPLLETAAVERLELRSVPGVGMVGTVRGAGAYRLGVGSVLDAVLDEEGQFVVVSCSHDERALEADITARRIAAGSFTTEPVLTGRVRWTHLGPRYTSRRAYRTASE